MAKDEFKSGFTFADLTALEKAIAEGVRRVKYTDKEIEYRSIDEMMKARALMRDVLGVKKQCGKKGLFGGRRIVAQHSKGLTDENTKDSSPYEFEDC